MLYLTINSKNELDFFISNLIDLIIQFGFIISLIGLLNLFTIISIRDSAIIDYNFALLPVFFGIIGIIYKLTTDISLIFRIVYNVFLIFSFTQVYLSGSRRGLIVISIIVLILVIVQLTIIIYRQRKSSLFFCRLRKVTLFPLFSLVLIPAFYYLILFHSSFRFKENVLDLLGTKNKSMAKYNLTERLNRCISVLGNNYDFHDLYNKIWTTVFDPYDPDSGWGIRIHKTIFPLKGDSVEIVPQNARGYLIDSTSNSDTWNGNAYSYTRVWSSKVENLDIINASVYCYVSEDFNGEWINLSCEGTTSGMNLTDYPLSMKGTWQKLTISPSCQDGEASVYLYLCKSGDSDFSSMRGHVIFAYPQVDLKKNKIQFDLKDTIISESINFNKGFKRSIFTANHSKYFIGSPIGKICKQDFEKSFLNNFPGDMRSNNEKGNPIWPISGFSDSYKYSKASFLSLDLLYNGMINYFSKDRDYIRRLASKFISEDTTYHGYKAVLSVDAISDSFLGPRLIRWQFALQIYAKEFNWLQKLFGGGFNFLNWYSYYFEKDKTKCDYPHNPFFSILLYSGILGFLFYLLLLFKTIKYYFLYFKEYSILSIYFSITFFFSFFSGGSVFDPPMMGFFIILPHFILSINKKTINI
jgi:hypothetical protein